MISLGEPGDSLANAKLTVDGLGPTTRACQPIFAGHADEVRQPIVARSRRTRDRSEKAPIAGRCLGTPFRQLDGEGVDYEYEQAGTAEILMFTEPLSGWRMATARQRAADCGRDRACQSGARGRRKTGPE